MKIEDTKRVLVGYAQKADKYYVWHRSMGKGNPPTYCDKDELGSTIGKLIGGK